MQSGKCIHLKPEIVDRAKLFAQKKNITMKKLVEGLINEKTLPRDCRVCKNPYCQSVGQRKLLRPCERYVR